jgi:CHAT domain
MDPGRLLSDGVAHYERWQATRSPADLASAIASFADLDAVLPADHSLRLPADLMFAMSLADRYRLTDSVDDIDGVIVRLTRVVALPGLPPDDFDGYRVALGRAVANRIDMYGRPSGPRLPGDAEFLDELRTATDQLAVAATTSSGLVTPAERTEAATLRAHLIPKLVLTQAIISRKAGKPTDIEELEHVLRELPLDHPNRPQLFLEAGLAHMSLVLRSFGTAVFLPTSDHRTLAVKYLSDAVRLLSPSYPERAKAIAYLSYLSATGPATVRRPDSLGQAAPNARELTAEALATSGLDQNLAAILHLVSGMAASPGQSPERLAEAVTELNRAMALARDPRMTEHFARIQRVLPTAILGVFSNLLSNLNASSPSLNDRDIADAYSRQLLQSFSAHGLLDQIEAETPWIAPVLRCADPPILRARAASDTLTAAAVEGDLAGVDRALAELDQRLAELRPDHEYRWLALGLLGAGWRVRGTLSGLIDDSVRGLKIQVTALDQLAANVSVTSAVDDVRRSARQRAASTVAELGRLTRDPGILTEAMERMSALGDTPAMTLGERAELSGQYGMSLFWRYALTRDPGDLDRAIEELEEASRIAGQDAGYVLLQNLSGAHWTRGERARRDRELAQDAGLRALRQRAAEALLQSGTAQCLRLARGQSSGQIVQLVNWCLAENRPDRAVEALELGRALALHAATVTTDIPGLLSLAHHDSLAEQWRAETGLDPTRAADPFPLPEPGSFEGFGADQPPLRIPSLLRRQVLSALHETPAGYQLLSAPRLVELADALRLADADAFVYLIPPDQAPGCALLLGADGGLDHVPLPGLSDTTPLDDYDDAYRAATGGGWTGDARLAWQQALAALCDWAWDAAIGPVLYRLGQQLLSGQPTSRAPRVALIPVGRLGVVPWHAARTTGADDRQRYAVEDAVFSYAASAGQFARASRRQRRPWASAPLLLSNPTHDLAGAELETEELQRSYYPHAVFLGQPAHRADGVGTPEEVLSRLPGGSAAPASLVHCGCHADVATSLAASHLLLADRRPLPIAAILAQAERHDPASPGFLAVLSACTTDLAHVDHDEALTLASGLLASGASAVIGARWPIGDRVTALAMVMFHHFLNNGHPRPADALRSTQLWMLDSARIPRGDLPLTLTRAAGSGSFLDAPHAWAGFTCHGA